MRVVKGLAAPTRTISGDRCQCATCGEYFNSTRAFDKHRTGSFAQDTRRCMSQDEMRAAGMAKNAQDFWVSAKLPAEHVSSRREKQKTRSGGLGHTQVYPGA